MTIAEVFSKAGIATAAVVSNWLLRRPDAAHGDAGVAQGFADFDDEMLDKEPNRESFERLAPATTDAAIRWLEKERAKQDDRFFLWVHFQDPHGPYTPPQEFVVPERQAARGEPMLPFGTTNKGKGQLPKYQRIGDEQR